MDRASHPGRSILGVFEPCSSESRRYLQQCNSNEHKCSRSFAVGACLPCWGLSSLLGLSNDHQTNNSHQAKRSPLTDPAATAFVAPGHTVTPPSAVVGRPWWLGPHSELPGARTRARWRGGPRRSQEVIGGRTRAERGSWPLLLGTKVRYSRNQGHRDSSNRSEKGRDSNGWRLSQGCLTWRMRPMTRHSTLFSTFLPSPGLQ